MPDFSALYSKASSISQKISSLNVSDALNSGVSKISSAVQSSLGGVTAQLKTSFGVNDLTSSVGSFFGTSPEDSRGGGFAGTLTYPAQMKYYTVFTFKEYQRVVVNKAAIENPSVSIVLPMPSNLSESFAVDYDTPSLGPIVGSLADSAIAKAREMQGGGNSSPSGQDQSSKELAPSIAAAIGAVGLKNVKATSETAGNIAAIASGVAPNPHLAVIFRNIGLREHSFQYRFAPNSQAELRTLKQIISNLKKRMLPGLTKGADVLYTFPDICDIQFGPNKNVPYTIKRCVLTSLNVNYAPNGPAFFTTGDPVIVDISMNFKEMSAFTREDIKTENETSEYGT